MTIDVDGKFAQFLDYITVPMRMQYFGVSFGKLRI